MCGIAFFSPNDPVSAQKLNLAIKALHHRGPDSHDTWISRSDL